MNIIPDLLLAALVVVSFIIGYKKGFIKSVWKIAALVITIVLVMALKVPAISFLSGTALASNIHARIAETVSIPQGGGVNIAEVLNLPDFMNNEVNNQINNTQEITSSINDTVCASLTNLFITIIACVALFIIIRLLLTATFMIINGVSKAPVINGVNRLAGGILAAVNIIFIVFIILALVSLFAPADSSLFEMIEHTYVVKYLYNYNILLQLFMKI